MVCFDLSGFKFLPSSVKLDYKTAWDTFERIQDFNSNVSTQRAAGVPGLTYLNFVSAEEKTRFTWGQYLHQQRYPNSNWNAVEKN